MPAHFKLINVVMVANVKKNSIKGAAKKKDTSANETSESIRLQTEAFLQSGGEIQYVNSGVSGQVSMKAPKHIILGNSSTKR